jgi:hypothetical protein
MVNVRSIVLACVAVWKAATIYAFSCGETDQTTWMRRIFGTYLSRNYACSTTLELAVNETETKVEKDPALGVLGYACFSYEDGAYSGIFDIISIIEK